MPQQGVSFDGSYIYLPGAYYADDVSAAGFTPPPTTPPLLFIGYGWGPKPKSPITFTNPQDLANALRGSPAAAFVPFMANPSPNLNGVQQVTFIDASENTQSAAALMTSGATTQMQFTSNLYGPPSNQMTVQVLPGSTAGLKMILFDGWSNSTIVGDNLTVPLQLAYSGQATGGVSFNVVTGAASGTFNVTSPIAGESISVPIGSGGFSTTSLLVQYLNGTGNYYAQLLSSTVGELPSLSLTAGSGALPIQTSGGLTYVNVPAYLNDPIFWANQFASTIVTAASGTQSADVFTSLPVTGAPTFFSGARGVPPVNNDYATALNVGLSTPAWAVFCDSNSTAVQALLAQHCETASSVPYGQWRRGFTGSSIGDSVSVTQTNAMNLDSIQMTYVYPGIYRTNTTTGQNQLYSGLYAAAAAAAISAGNIIALPLTNKPLNANGVEQVNAGSPLTTSQLNTLQNSGVMAVWTPNQTGIPTFLSDVTTWQDDNNVENTSAQQVSCRYWLAYSMVNVLQPYVGTIASPFTEINILNAVKSALNALIYTGGSSNGVLASWVNKSLQLVYTGSQQLAAISFQAVLVGQNKYITCFATIEPLNFTITASG